MIKKLVITDVSRMKGSRVCIFGIDEEGNNIRPILLPPGINEEFVQKRNIEPFSIVELDLEPCKTLKPPHLEDWWMNTSYDPKLIGQLIPEEQIKFLEKIKDHSIESIFGAELHQNHYIFENEGKRSLGTIETQIIGVSENKFKDGHGKYKITFLDNGNVYNLSVTDLRFKKYCDQLEYSKNMPPEDVAMELTLKIVGSVTFFAETRSFVSCGL